MTLVTVFYVPILEEVLGQIHNVAASLLVRINAVQ